MGKVDKEGDTGEGIILKTIVTIKILMVVMVGGEL